MLFAISGQFDKQYVGLVSGFWVDLSLPVKTNYYEIFTLPKMDASVKTGA